MGDMTDDQLAQDEHLAALDDVLEYDGDERVLVATNRLGPGEYGASSVVAHDVAPWFGIWAEAAWRDPATPAIRALIALRERVDRLTSWPGVVRSWPHETPVGLPEHVVAISREETLQAIDDAIAAQKGAS